MKITKIPLNSTTTLFRWIAAEPIDGTPTITFKMTAGDQSPVMTVLHSAATVTAIGNNRSELTISPVIANFAGLSGHWGQAWLETVSDSAYPVLITRVAGSTAHLAEPLPRGVDLAATASLEWATWTCTPGAAITGTLGAYTWRVNYVSRSGADAPSTSRQDDGILSVVRRPFNVGLSHYDLCALVPSLADMVPRRQQDFNPQISLAEDEVGLMVRERVEVDGFTEDDLFNAHIFSRTTAYLSAAIIYEGVGQFDAAQQFRDKGADAFDRAARSVIIDIAGTGDLGLVADLASRRQAIDGGRKTDVRGSMASRSQTEYEKTFVPTRGMRH